MKRSISFLLGTFLFASIAFASEGGAADSSSYGFFAIASALAIGLAALGGALGQGRAAAAALDGIARNPGASGKIFVPMIIGMALIESLVIFGFVISYFLFSKIG